MKRARVTRNFFLTPRACSTCLRIHRLPKYRGFILYIYLSTIPVARLLNGNEWTASKRCEATRCIHFGPLRVLRITG